MKETEKAYIAGLVDGDGSIMLLKCHTDRGIEDHILRLRIGQTTEPVLTWVKLVTGVGNIHRPKRNSPLHRSRYEWSCAGKKAFQVIQEIEPYLIVKKVHAAIAFRFMETMPGHGHPLTIEMRTTRVNLRKELDKHLSHRGHVPL